MLCSDVTARAAAMARPAAGLDLLCLGNGACDSPTEELHIEASTTLAPKTRQHGARNFKLNPQTIRQRSSQPGGRPAKPLHADPKASRAALQRTMVVQAAGNSRVSPSPTDASRPVCVLCQSDMSNIIQMCQPAVLTPSELNKYKRTTGGEYNYTRLKAVLSVVAFDASGNCLVHAK